MRLAGYGRAKADRTKAGHGDRPLLRRKFWWPGNMAAPLGAVLAMSMMYPWYAAGANAVVEATPPRVAQAEKTYRFDIAPQPLGKALSSFIRTSGWQIGYAEETVRGLQSGGVRGTLSAEQALKALLSGTGLIYRVSNGDTVALERAGSGAGGAIQLDPVTVTGERVDRSLRHTGSSVAVFDTDAIVTRPGVDGTNELMTRIPNVVANEASGFAPAVRGLDGTGPAIGANAFFAGTRPRLNYQVDGRPSSYNEVLFSDVPLWDVDQVEVFRGPQSTLQGRNAIAGAVVVKTKDPTYDWETAGRFAGGNFESREAAAMISGPILEEQLAFRLAVDYKRSQSYLDFTPYAEVEDPGQFESLGIRGKLLIEPKKIDGFKTLLTVNYLDFIGPQAELVAPPADELQPSSPNMPTFNPRAISATMETSYKINNQFTVENTISGAGLRIQRRAPAGMGNASITGYEIREEPQLRFALLDGKLNGFGGLHYFKASQDESIDIQDSTYDDSTRTMSAFGEATYTVFDNIDFLLGGRFEREHRRRVGGTAPLLDIDFDETYDAFLPKVGVAWHASDDVTVGAVVSRGFNGGGAGVSFDAPFVAYTYDPEYVWNYEAYARADLLDRRLSLTGNIFFADYKDLQLPFNLSSLSTVIRNADRAITYGAEMGAKWLPMRGLTLSGDIGLLKTEITEYDASGFEGNDLPRSPALTASFGALYEHRSGFEIGSDVQYSETYFSDVANTPRGKVDPYWVWNAQAGFTHENVRVFAFVRNILDSANVTVLSFIAADPANDSAQVVHPRTWGAGVTISF